MNELKEYKLYFEVNKQQDLKEVQQFISTICKGATLQQATGLWCGVWSHSFILTVIGSCKLNEIKELAIAIKKQYQQQAVYVTVASVKGGLL